jgi:hypothetical protein
MNFYWFKLDWARLKLIDILDARYIYFIFLNPRMDYDLLKEIYFIHFYLKFTFLQILWYLLKYSNNQNNSENAKGIKCFWACFGPGAAAHRLADWVCWVVAKKASQAPHIAQQGVALRDLAMAARRCGCSGEPWPPLGLRKNYKIIRS